MRKVDPAKYEEKRRRILRAAHGCFRRDGFRGASISDICAAAKMSPGHLYHYFESKEAIIKALIGSRVEEGAAFFAKLTESADLPTGLSMLMRQRLKRLRAHRFSLLLEMSAESAHDPSIAAVVRGAERGTRELLSRLIRRGQEGGRIDRELDPDIAATVLANIFFGLNQLAVLKDPTFDLDAVARMLRSLLERFLRAR